MARQLRLEDYTVGWVCALPVELAAAQEMLDEEHNEPERNLSGNDDNLYALGSIGGHNVAIVCLPAGWVGNNPAAAVAIQMRSTYKGIRFGLMVGTGGGVPSAEAHIRLGDVVVSQPNGTFGGVVQYDFGKTTSSGFERTGSLNSPPQILLGALAKVQANELRGKSSLFKHLSKFERHPKFQRSKAGPDLLFQQSYDHQGDQTCNRCDVDMQEIRQPRESDEVVVHYGTIASGNQAMRKATERDKVSAGLGGVLCFEMEAAGLMNSFPCLVIRGICDYADSHKNKKWQPYAAATAAAYAKEVLLTIPPSRVEAEKKIGEVLAGLQEVAEVHCGIAQKQLKIQQETVKQKLSDKQRECLQLFRLTKSTKDTTYEWYKDRVEDRVQDTCMWFLEHDHFQEWLRQESRPLLVSADPGCGKSVLAKYLVDKYLTDHALSQSATICYFFFKDQDQNTVRQALCALLHQLFVQKPSLIEHAIEQYKKDGQGLINSTKSLWTILGDTVQDPQAGSVIIVLDALDECAELEFEDLIKNIERQFHGNQSNNSKLKYLLTSRPYEQILSNFRCLLHAFPRIHIPGEEKSEIISREVNRVIQYRIEQLAREKVLSEKVKSCLTDQLLKITHRTYLWVYLVFDYLKTECFKKTPEGVKSTIKSLPKSVYQAYESILSKSKEHLAVRKILCIILAASRPLTLSEMNVAINIDEKSKAFHEIDLEEEEDLKLRLRSWCGLFISIHHGNIYLLHQTAREFLLTNLPLSTMPPELKWQHSITIYKAHSVLAEACVRYLNFFNSDASLPPGTAPGASHHAHGCAFLDYSARFWVVHLREACFDNDHPAITHLALKIIDPGAKAYSAWSRIYWRNRYIKDPRFVTDLTVASYFGHGGVVKLLLQKSANLESKNNEYERTPLLWAAKNGHETVVKLLLDKDANLDSTDKYSQTPLLYAAEYGHVTVIKLLLDKGVNLESIDKYGWTPLLRAAEYGHEAVVKLLLEKGANLESTDKYGQTPLFYAVRNKHETVVKLLLDKGANFESTDENGQTPLLWAVKNKNETVIKLLLDKDPNIESTDEYGRTPLLYAAENGHEAVVKLLLKKGANLESIDKHGQTPLLWAAKNKDETVVKLLLDKGANLESIDKDGQTPLLWAAKNKDETVVKLLLDKGANLESIDKHGQTPLLWAAKNKDETVVKLLLDKGANIESTDKHGQTPLLWAAKNKDETVVKLLLDKGANLESIDKHGQTPLLWAAENEDETVVKLLLDKDANIESTDEDGQTPLLWAAKNKDETIVKLLLDKGANIESTDEDGQTPLLWAAKNEDETVVKLLLDKGANIESTDKYGRTPLVCAASNRHKTIVKLLLDKGANLKSTDKDGRTLLLRAKKNGYKLVVKEPYDKGAL